MKFGVLFSGQGAQKAGMGCDFLADPLFKETIAEASEAARLDLVQVFKSEHGELDQTKYVQPALVAFEAALWKLIERDADLDVAGMAGLSLGEYGALLASGALAWPAGIALVASRGEYMQADSDRVASTMAALLKPNLAKLEAAVKRDQAAGWQVYVCNYNSPKQVVVGGSRQDLPKLLDQVAEEQLAKRAIELNVAGAFHTPLYQNSAQKLHDRLKGVEFRDPAVPVVSNTLAAPFAGERLAEVLEVQLARPTHFDACVKYLLDQGKIEATLEVGPGQTLTKFAKAQKRDLKQFSVGTWPEYEKFVEAANNGFAE